MAPWAAICARRRIANLGQALGLGKLPLDAWAEEGAVPNRFNRALLYRADLVHSTSGYCGEQHTEKRMSAVFFWMC